MNRNTIADFYHKFHHRTENISSALGVEDVILPLYFKGYPNYKRNVGGSDLLLGVSSPMEASKEIGRAHV